MAPRISQMIEVTEQCQDIIPERRFEYYRYAKHSTYHEKYI